MTQVTALLDIPNPPAIHCVSKTLGPSPFNAATQKSSLTLTPPGNTFEGDLYIQVTVQNGTPGAATTVDIRDILPPEMTFQGDVQVQQPLPTFNLGPNPVVGSSGIIEWHTVDSLAEGATLQFYFKVHLKLNAPGSVTNSSLAKASSDADYPPGACSGSATLFPGGKVPSLSDWGAIILMLVLAASAIWLLRRRRVN